MLTKENIEKYFMAEKAESMVFMAIGIAGIIAAVIFFFIVKSALCKGAVIPLLAIGLLLAIVGFTIYNRSDADRIKNIYTLTMNPGELKEKELPRMEQVMKNFVLYRYIEIGLCLLGIILFMYYYNNEAMAFWKGVGLALAIMVILALLADYFAEKRGGIYFEQLSGFAGK
jgi:drug/metabolite transporter (DMT)-like permease